MHHDQSSCLENMTSLAGKSESCIVCSCGKGYYFGSTVSHFGCCNTCSNYICIVCNNPYSGFSHELCKKMFNGVSTSLDNLK